MSVILTSNDNEIPFDSEIFDNTEKLPKISGYVDMLSVAGNDYGKDGYDNQAPIAYETSFSAIQSKKKGIRRVRFQDTDDNSVDAVEADYSASDVSAIFPRSLASGEWGDELTGIIAEIDAVRKTLPKFYAKYCTSETASKLDEILSAIDEAMNDEDVETLEELKSQLEEAAKNLSFKYDSKIAQVYVATDKGDGTSYGTSLVKANGYVSAQLVVVDTDGAIMAGDLSWAGEIKVRGNSTAGGAKRPYNMKFSSKVDLFGFGKAKKWVLLADFFDPTLTRNKTAFDMGKILGLEATMDCRRVEVWVDGNYRGMYLLTEKIEADDNRVNIKPKKGDFLIEMDTSSRAEADSVYITTTVLKRYYKMHEPEEPTAEQKTAILAKMADFEKAISSGTWADVEAVIDVDSFVSFYILNEYMKTVDFVWLSVYFYCKDGIIYAGPAWDYDLSSGNLGTSYSASARSPEGIYAGASHYFSYLSKFTEFQLAVSEKLREAGGSDIIGQILSGIDGDTDYYAEAIARNNATWKPSVLRSGLQIQPKSTYEANLTYLTDWLASRDLWMTDYFLARTYISSDAFPDPAILEYVRAFDTNNDSFLSTTEKNSVTSFDLSGLNLTSLNLAGLELFPSLESLDVTDNPGLSRLNVAKFPGLSVIHDDGLIITGIKPIFTAHSLVLSGQIGVDFYIDVPEDSDTEGAYMDFAINGKNGNPSMFDNADKTKYGYMFTHYINSVQMADKITATFRYGGETISQDFSAKDYLDAAIANTDEDFPYLLALLKAIKDYGHYVQKPLADYNGWKIGVKHAEMDCYSTDITLDSPDVMDALSSYAMKKDINGSGIEDVQMNLELDSETTLNIYLVVSKDYTGNVVAYLDGSDQNMAVKESDGTYRVTIGGISAHKLGDTYTLHVEAGKNFDVKASALSYAYAVMKSDTVSTDLKKAVIALYKYYDATMNYRTSDEYIK